MKKSRVWKWIATIGTSALLLFAFIFSIGGGDLIGSLGQKEGDTTQVAQAAGLVERPAGATFGQFANGYTYVYTDKGLITDFRAGKIATEMNTQTVSTSATHGTAANPYVIENVTDWENLVKYVSTSANSWASGKVFVLAKDIDFSGVTYRFLPNFNGTLYGVGHKLSNMTSSVWQYWNGSAWANVGNTTNGGFGALVGSATNAVIADLVLENFQLTGIPSSTGLVSNWGGFTSGLVGASIDKTYLLNCHVQGTMANSTYGVHCHGGAFVGLQFRAGGYIYRCSGDVELTVTTSSKSYNIHAGSLVGDVYNDGSSTVYDSVANVAYNVNVQNTYMGAVAGYLRSGTTYIVENTIAYIKYKSVSAKETTWLSGFFGGTTQTGTFKMTNVYVNSSYVTDTSNLKFYYQNSHTSTYSNVIVGPYITGSPGGVTAKTTREAVLDAAKGDIGTKLSDKIWDKNKVPTTVGMGTFTPDKSPVRNYLTQVPLDAEFEYTGEQIDITAADWFMDSVHGNPDIMTYSAPTMVNANETGYIVTFNLKDGFTWSDGTQSPKQIRVKVRPKKLSISWDTSGGIAVAKIGGGLVAKDTSNPPEIVTTYYFNGSKLPGSPQTVGDYVAKASIAPGGNYRLKDSDTDPDPEFAFHLSAIPITVPTVSGDLTKQYTGEDISFLLVNDEAINEGKIVEPTQSEMPAGVTYTKEGNKRTITVKAVGTYKIPFALTDQTNTCWSDGSGYLTLTITPRPINLTVERPTGLSWEFETNTQEQFTITHDAIDGDNIALSVSYVKPDETVVTVGADKMVTAGKVTTVTLDPFDRGVYKIRVGLAGKTASNDNGNYTLVSMIEQNVTVKGKVIKITEADVIWRYSDGQSLKALERNAYIPYAGRTITVSIDTKELAEKGVRVAEYKNETGLIVGGYNTSVTLTKLNESYEYEDQTFTIPWNIEQAKFDLSEVKWNYEDPIGYTGSFISVTLLNVPADLTVQYTGNRNKEVSRGGGHYEATVNFKCSNNNYIVPQMGYDDSYIYEPDGGGSFPWKLEWQIKKGTLALNWDLYGASDNDPNGDEYYYPTLINGEGKVTYKFYLADPDTREQGEEITRETQLIATPGHEVYYWIEAILTEDAATNYELGQGSNPLRFTVGQNKTPVTLHITKMGGMYTGEQMPVEFTYEVVQGTTVKLTDNDFMLTYYNEDGSLVADENGIAGAPINAGTYKVRFSIMGAPAEEYYIKSAIEYTFTIEKFKVNWDEITWNYDEPFTFEYKDGAEVVRTVELKGLPSTLLITYEDNSFSAAGTYTATVTVAIDEALKDNYEPLTLPNSLATLNWAIKMRELTVPQQIVSGLTYSGETFDLIELAGLDSDWKSYIEISVKKGVDTVSGTTVTNAGTYVVVCTIKGEVYNSVKWANNQTIDQSCSIMINPKIIKVVGWQGKPSIPLFEDTVSSSMYKVVYKDAKEQEVPNPNDGQHYGERLRATVVVPEGMAGNVLIVYDDAIKNYDEFIIFNPSEAPTLLSYPELVNPSLAYNFEELTFVIKDWKNYKDYVTVLDSLTVEGVGTFKVRVALKNDKNVMWKDLTSDIYTLTLTVTRGRLAEKWDKTQEIPTLLFEDAEDYVIDLASVIEYEYYDMDGSPVKAGKLKPGVRYEVVARIKEEYAGLLGFGADLEEETSLEFVFGEVTPNPDKDPVKPDPDEGDKKDDVVDPPVVATRNLPLWQLIVGGISAVLFVICAAKAFGEYGKMKAAKTEAKELASVSYSASYAFAPLPLLALGVGETFLNMNNTAWTAIALVAVGLFLVSLVAMMMLTKKRKAAELVVRREKARIEEEKEYMRQEEQLRREEDQRMRDEQMREDQRRRDDEMKMMFAAMQQGFQQQQSMNYGDMQNMIAASMQALLPAVSQMAALPPAQSDPNAYGAPAPYADPNAGYAAPQYGAPAANNETDELRAKLERQEALINQLLQNQQASQAAYASYDPEERDEAYWQNDGEDTVPLEESYGRLSDEAKRCYYDLGSYIMTKPRVSQNDGKFAVLFRYRGKTLFKLCIKGDAPVFVYLLDSGAKDSIRLSDAASLNAAKTVIDQSIMKRDRELG